MTTTPTAVASAPAVPRRGARVTLLWLVFSCGLAVMGLEMTASQLIKPYFGSTISVWTSLIGLVMVFLTCGYYLGGALADRRPTRGALGAIVLLAGLAIVVLPVVGIPVLRWAWGFTPKLGLLGGSFLGVLLLFSLPNLLLGCVGPFAMKLSIRDLGRAGKAAGGIYAISALGSVVGTFLPVLLLTYTQLGVRHIIMVFGALLILAAVLLLSRVRYAPALGTVALLALPLPPMLSVPGVLAERESAYNYLQVIEVPGKTPEPSTRKLIVDWGCFSSYTPGEFRTEEYYDYLLLAPLMREAPKTWLKRVLVVGLAAGTVAKQITQAYGPVDIEGVEIDPAIIDLGRRYFNMKEPNLRVHVTDGRTFLAASKQPYDWVIVDAYQGGEIPSHLITREFFQQLKAHLTPGGVLSINIAWYEPDDQELVRRLATTVGSVFPYYYAITGISQQSGAVLLAGFQPVTPEQLVAHARQVGHKDLTEIASDVGYAKSPKLEVPATLGEPLTDDQGLVNSVVDRMYRASRQSKERHAQERRVLGL